MNSKYSEIVLEKFNKHHILDLMSLCDLLPEIDKSTLYRNLKSLSKQGLLKEVLIKEGITSYELASHKHQHLLCTSCNNIEELDICAEELQKLVPEHVRVESLELKISGLCTFCRNES